MNTSISLASDPVPAGRRALPSVPTVWTLLLFGLVVLSPMSSKLAGLSLFVMLGLALWAAWRYPASGGTDPLVRDWFVVAAAVLLLRGVSTVFWHDSWGDRHFEIRLLLSGLILWLWMSRLSLSPAQIIWLWRALALACWSALGVTGLHGRDTPTNPIPWAAGVSFLVCILLAHAAESRSTRGERGFLLISALAGLIGVILSQSRGSFGLVPWFFLVIALVAWRSIALRRKGAALLGSLVLVAGLVLVLLTSQPRLYQDPMARIQEAEREYQSLVQAVERHTVTPAVLDTSVGARLYIYIHGWAQIQQEPVWGQGASQRKTFVQALGQSSGSSTITSLNHLHSDPLSIWFEHGLLGLASYLLSVAGLAWLAWRSMARGLGMGLGFAGLAWMHLSSGLTNVNTLHNFYGVMLSLSVMLLFLLNAPGPQETALA